MQTEFSSALARHLMATYAPDASGNAWMLGRLHKAVRDPNLVTLDPALNVKREDINITPTDLAVFFYYAALGIDMAHEHTIMGVPLDLPKGSLRVYVDPAVKALGYTPGLVGMWTHARKGLPGLSKIHSSFSYLINNIFLRRRRGTSIAYYDANYPERSLTAHEFEVLSFLEESRHIHCYSLPDSLRKWHFTTMRKDIFVHKKATPHQKKVYSECNIETDARNLKYVIFTLGDGFSRIPEPEQVYRHFGAAMPKPSGVG